MAFQGDSIFWVDTEKVVPNPFQPRREFDQNKLQELSESIRMYGVLQPLTVTRSEVQRDDGTFYTEYELIAGERRLRASRLAGVAQVPVIIREGEQNEQEKLELAIIENLQREDLNAIDRALAFQQLAEQFELSHTQVAQKVGRSREYVSNSIRLLALPEHMRLALQRGELGEGHARTLLMLNDKPQEQETIFREILLKKMSVREVERIVRKIATDKVRKKQHSDIGDHLIEIEKEFTETLGTRVQIQKTEFGGKLTIDYFSEDDLSAILKRMQAEAPDGQVPTAAAAMAVMAAATPLMNASNPEEADSPNSQIQDSPTVHEQPDEPIQPHWQPKPVVLPESEPTVTETEQSIPSAVPSKPTDTESRAALELQHELVSKPVPEVPVQSQSDTHATQSVAQVPVEQFTDERASMASVQSEHKSESLSRSQPESVPFSEAQTPLQHDPYKTQSNTNAQVSSESVGVDNPSEVSVTPKPEQSQSVTQAPETSAQITEHTPPATVLPKNDESAASQQNLAASDSGFFHTAFGFSRPAPDTHTARVAPERHIEQSQSGTTTNNEQNQESVSQSTSVEPKKPKDESEDIYSVRNFSI
jgi:ParB family chromosome partitioning protein